MFADEESRRFVLRQANRTELPLLLGSLEEVHAKGQPDELVHRNSAVLLTEYATNVQTYQKRHLVPFGEYLPMRDIFPDFIRELIPGDIDPGEAPKVLSLDKPAIKIGALVCFEDSLQRETRDIVRAGAQVLVNITNDAWFAQTAGSAQHFANAHLRSVEARLPMLRSTNTGVTCSVDAIGRVESHLQPFSEGIETLSVKVPVHPRPTIYTRFGDLWIIACALNASALWPRRRKTTTADSSRQSTAQPE
jgi:apolipoprotein N-acyltransferase